MVEVALITGCATGIGRALAEDLHKRTTAEGKPAFRVYATDYRLELLKELEEQGIGTAQLDVTSPESIKKAVDKVLAEAGRIDLLVCNAGLSAAGFLAELEYKNVERLFAVNVHGVFRCVQAVAPYMMAQRSGKIATLCSVNSYVVQPFNAPYSGTKAAVAIMTEALAMEVSSFGVSVTSVIPGWVKSEILPSGIAEFERYERPESFYHTIIHKFKEFRQKARNYGFTPQKAAEDIGNGLSKPKPPRFLYTGTYTFQALASGLIQQWVWPAFIARDFKRQSGLDQLGKPSSDNSKKVPLSLQKEE